MLSLMQPFLIQPWVIVPFLLTSALAAAAVAAGMIALQVRGQATHLDLQVLHREVDQLRELVSEAEDRGEDASHHRERLRRIQGLLPPDDLRRV